MFPEISLVITTYHRYETFLKDALTKYVANPYIHEVVIYDDHSEDFDKLRTEFSHDKLRLFQQPENKGALRNKLAAIAQARHPWVCLMDSDNFCDVDYFKALHRYWATHGENPKTLYAPESALPNFNFTTNTRPVHRRTWNQLHRTYDVLLNTGNYVFHRDLVPYVLPIEHDPAIQNYLRGFPEVKYMNYIWIRDADATLKVVPRMRYQHAVHPNSLWMQTAQQCMDFNATFNWTLPNDECNRISPPS